ncbi:MAG: L-aspartate oxidase [Phycisphaerae bacterium]
MDSTRILQSPYNTPRFLTNFDAKRIGTVETDVLIIGAGVAGLRAALAAADYGLVTVLSKQDARTTSTAWAQGGVAAALAPEDHPTLHAEDTLRVGCGMCREHVVHHVMDAAPDCIHELQAWGMPFDEREGALALGREGGHGQNRVAHALGDQTGQALAATLSEQVARHQDIRLFEGCFLIDFLVEDQQCIGAVTYHEKYGHQLILAENVILASGGCGQLWRETTNPVVSTGDGIAAAFRAGATLASLELMQFHPTTLYVAGSGRALISEAVRGAGAYLVDMQGQRFMQDYDDAMELAPRDIVSRAIDRHIQLTGHSSAFLDVRHIEQVSERFPHLAKRCSEFQIDVTRDLIPVRPSAHYMIGGVDVDLQGRTEIKGLFACGEAAHTGLHGANRLASNSLLEGLVFGRDVGSIAGQELTHDANRPHRISNRNPSTERTALDLTDIRHSLRSVMWRNAGIVRHGDRLRETMDILRFWSHYTLDKTLDEPQGWEIQNMLMLGFLVAGCAEHRTLTTGVHFRSDESRASDAPIHAVEGTQSQAKENAAFVTMQRQTDHVLITMGD